MMQKGSFIYIIKHLTPIISAHFFMYFFNSELPVSSVKKWYIHIYFNKYSILATVIRYETKVQDSTKLLSVKWDIHAFTLWGTSPPSCTQRGLFHLQSTCCNWWLVCKPLVCSSWHTLRPSLPPRTETSGPRLHTPVDHRSHPVKTHWNKE